MADNETVRACLEQQAELAREGTKKRLGELLVSCGALSESTVEKLLKRHRQHILKCVKCGVWFGVRGYSSEKTYRCKHCDEILTEGSHVGPALGDSALYPARRCQVRGG